MAGAWSKRVDHTTTTKLTKDSKGTLHKTVKEDLQRAFFVAFASFDLLRGVYAFDRTLLVLITITPT